MGESEEEGEEMIRAFDKLSIENLQRLNEYSQEMEGGEVGGKRILIAKLLHSLGWHVPGLSEYNTIETNIKMKNDKTKAIYPRRKEEKSANSDEDNKYTIESNRNNKGEDQKSTTSSNLSDQDLQKSSSFSVHQHMNQSNKQIEAQLNNLTKYYKTGGGFGSITDNLNRSSTDMNVLTFPSYEEVLARQKDIQQGKEKSKFKK